GEKQHAMREAAHAKEKSGQESTTVFLITERKRLKKTSKKMNTSDALKTYNESANMDLRKPQIDLDADPDKDEAIGSRGILINKKQY
ncbi:MAG: hypothetical protein KC478_17270, partial [Bacteriovoracaceae bacterium]|nr:hypothetical protein [Bacteriovoracaceae bacterium]